MTTSNGRALETVEGVVEHEPLGLAQAYPTAQEGVEARRRPRRGAQGGLS